MNKLFNKINYIRQIISKDFIRNSGLQLIERFISLLLSFISSLFIIRYFTPIDYGIFAYASSYVILFSALTTLGINSIAVRELVKHDYSNGEILGSSFIIMFLGSLFALVLIIGSSLISNNSKLTNWVILIYCFNFLLNSLSVINFYFQSKIRTDITAGCMFIQNVLDFFAKLFLVYIRADIIWFAIESLISNIILYILLYFFYKYETVDLKWSISLKAIRFIFKQSLPLAISGAMINVYMRIDQIMLEYYHGLKSVAEYSVGIKLIEIVYILPTIIAPNIFPVLIKQYKKSTNEFNILFLKILRYTTVIALLLIFVFFTFGPTLIHLFYGEKYKNAGIVLRWFSLCILPVFIGVISSLWLQINNLQNKQFYQTLMGLIVCLGLNLILIPKYCEVGAVYSIVVAQFVTGIFSSFLFKDLRPLFNQYIEVFKFDRYVIKKVF